MHQVLILGAGKIGSLISFILSHSNDYSVHLADVQDENPFVRRLGKMQHFKYVQLDAKKSEYVIDYIKQHQINAVISALPYYCNKEVASLVSITDCHYFDLTEDVETAHLIHQLANHKKQAFVPQCGLAPGFVSIIANQLMKKFPTLDTVKMRVGALPLNVSNALQYSLTWSTDGLINEYGNPCEAIEDGRRVNLMPLEGLEQIKIDGLTYEAFNTSGGIGSLVETYEGKVKHLSYKTIRYPGHCEKIKFLMNDLKLNQDRSVLKNILEHALPKTYQDVVIIYVSANGMQDNQFVEEHYVRKFYPQHVNGHEWSAIQLTTAYELCTIVDLVLSKPDHYHGFIRHEKFSLTDITQNRFGVYFALTKDKS